MTIKYDYVDDGNISAAVLMSRKIALGTLRNVIEFNIHTLVEEEE